MPAVQQSAEEAQDSGALHAVALKRAALAPHIAVHTIRLLDTIRVTEGSWAQRMRSVVSLLQTDGAQPESLLDLSLVVEGDESCVLFELLRFLSSCCVQALESGVVQADKAAAHKLICDCILPRQTKLLRSFDPATVDAATGNNALHEMGRLFTMRRVESWSFKLNELLIARGVSVEQRNKAGRTPLLQYAAGAWSQYGSIQTLQLLLSHGSDVNAADGEGNGVLHHLVQRECASLLEGLWLLDGVDSSDFHLVNEAGQTAVDLAVVRLAQQVDSGTDSPAKRIHRLLMTQSALWAKLVRPQLQLCLDGVLPVADLAKLALDYVDGSGLPFASSTVAADADNVDNQPAAADAPPP